MIKTAAGLGMKGIALTDHECLSGHLKWLKAEKELKEKEIISKDFKAALGNEIYLVEDRDNIDRYWHYILIAKNNIGHRALRELSSIAWYNGFNSRGMMRVPTTMEELENIVKKYPNSLIATSACFIHGTEVLTKEGIKKIEEITSNDYILNRYGKWEKVNFPTQRPYFGKGKKILFCENPTPIICTENHKFLITSNNMIKRKSKEKVEWCEAKDLIIKTGAQKHICLFPLQTVLYNNNFIINKDDWKNKLKQNYSIKKPIKEQIILTPEIMRFFGLWIGDGHISINKDKNYYRVGFTFSDEEFPYYWESFVKKASEQIGIEWSINKREEHHRIDIYSASIELCELFFYLFGEVHADNKFFPERLLNISYELNINLIFGYMLADGYFRERVMKNNYTSGEMVCASISSKLIKQLQEILRSIDIRSSISIREEKTGQDNVHHKESYYLSSSNNAWILVKKKTNYTNEDILNIFSKAVEHDSKKIIVIDGIKYKKVYIKSIEDIELNETVYCLNVDSHSFVCNNVIVHNCLGSKLDGLVLKLIDAEKKDNNEEIFNIKTEIDKFIRWNIKLFGDDFYIEIAAGQSKEQIKFNQRIGIIAKAYQRKIVIGSDAHYLTIKERPLHKAYLNSKEGEREVDEFYRDAHMMDNNEAFENLKNIFSEDDFKEMCVASMEIYDKIEGYSLEHSAIIPHVEVKDYKAFVDNSLKQYSTLFALRQSENQQERYWVNECLIALKQKQLDNDKYLERLEIEAKIIKIIGKKLNNCLFEYFNTFQHYIDLFWECGSIVGPGRGSAVCFLSNYLLGITQLDPIQWELPFWRFLNEERVELPDIDIDLSPSKRKKIFEAIREERGELNVIQVCTFGTEGTRSAIAAAGRGYRSELYPHGLEVEITQYLSGLIPQERGFLWPIHDVVYGNLEKDRTPINAFILEVQKYPGLLEIIESIEGLVNKRGQHASGVILYNNSPFETNAIMRSPNGDLTTQFSLHEAEALGDVKYDFLVTEICDKITTCIELMQKDNVVEKDLTLRQIYNKYLHPSVLNLKDERIWKALGDGSVLDVFQFNTGVGLATAKQVKPKNPTEMTSANAIMRLMGEKGKERPLDRYCRLKNNMDYWYQEVRNRGLSEEEIKILEPYYLPAYGVPALQEDLMLVCMDEKIGNFSLKEANAARKTVAKKHMEEIPNLHEKFVNQCPNRNFGEYVWETTMGPQMGYAFARPHSLAYSFVGIQTLYLATNYPSIYWNCACLIVNAGGAELLEFDEDDEESDEKSKNNSVNYGKIGIAIGKMKENHIKVFPPDINKSSLIFSPDIENNAIIYGLKGLNRIGDNLIKEIIKNRPYSSIEDFLSKVKVNKPQMINLIKSGAFDTLYPCAREAIMDIYLNLIADKKKRITLQNMQMLIAKDLIPKELDFEKRLFNFNKYLKKFKDGDYYILDVIAATFFNNNYDESLLTDIKISDEDYSAKILQKTWDAIYKKGMEPVRVWMKENQESILNQLNQSLLNDAAEKYTEGSVSKWEMDSLSFYYHEHELENLRNDVYEISDFFKLPSEPEIDRKYTTKEGNEIALFKLSRIAGTVIDKDKNKSTVSLLTTSGVVSVKVWKSQFAKWDKQISERNEQGEKHVVEKSFFARGNKLIITGVRRDDTFIPKKYRNTIHPLFERIDKMENGFILESKTKRADEVEE